MPRAIWFYRCFNTKISELYHLEAILLNCNFILTVIFYKGLFCSFFFFCCTILKLVDGSWRKIIKKTSLFHFVDEALRFATVEFPTIIWVKTFYVCLEFVFHLYFLCLSLYLLWIFCMVAYKEYVLIILVIKNP